MMFGLLLVGFTLVVPTIQTYYTTYPDYQDQGSGGILGYPSSSGCKCSCDYPRPEPRRTSDVLPLPSRPRRKGYKYRHEDRLPVPEPRVDTGVLPLANNIIDPGSRGVSVNDPIPQSLGPINTGNIGRVSPILKNQGMVMDDIRNGFGDSFDNGFQDPGTNLVSGVRGFPTVETNGRGFPSIETNGRGFPTVESNGDIRSSGILGDATDPGRTGFTSDPNFGLVPDNAGIQDRFNGDGFASIGGIREGSRGYGHHEAKYSKSYKRSRRRRRYKY